jgi:hypothetical protein
MKIGAIIPRDPALLSSMEQDTNWHNYRLNQNNTASQFCRVNRPDGATARLRNKERPNAVMLMTDDTG